MDEKKKTAAEAVDRAVVQFCNMGCIKEKCPYCGKTLVRIVVGGMNKICCENGCVAEAWC